MPCTFVACFNKCKSAGDITEIEKVQKRATKLIISFKKFPYKERLRRLNLPTLKYRRVRGDMIEVFKIISNIYDASSVPTLPLDTSSVTRGISFKLSNLCFYHDIRKYAFVPRIINTVYGTVCQISLLKSILLMYLRNVLINTGHIKISRLITQLKLPESEIDQS